MRIKGMKYSLDSRRKMSETHKINWATGKETAVGRKKSIRKPLSEKTKEKISNSNLGKKRSLETRKRISIAKKGKKLSEEHIYKIKVGNTGKHSGKCSNLWKNGKTSLYRNIRDSPKYKEWREKIFKRDNYKCFFKCDNKKLVAHHIVLFKVIIEKYKINSYEDAINCKELWDTNNGLTVCNTCHNEIHSESQINQFNMERILNLNNLKNKKEVQ